MLSIALLSLAPLCQTETTAPDTIPGPAGYAIPVLDLDGDAARQVVVDRESGQYLGHVTTVLLEDGRTMLAAYPKGHGAGAIVLKRSTDGGRTWSERLDVPASFATSREVPTLFRTTDPAGETHLLLFSGLDPIRMSHSEDDGATWTELAPIGDYGGIVACSSLVRLTNGELLAMFHDDGRFLGEAYQPTDGRAFHVFQIRSSDGGLTWGPPRAVASHPRAQLCEPLLLRSPDGKQLLCLMRENSRRFNSFCMTSDDEGATWSTPHQVSAALTGDRHTGGYAPDGRLFLSFRDTARRSPTQGDWVGWVGTYGDIVAGRDGQYRVRLKDNHHAWDCAYPGVELLPDGAFVCTTYGHWEEGESPYILSTRLRLAELDRLAAAGEVLPNPPNPAVVPVPRGGWWRDRFELLCARTQAAREDPDNADPYSGARLVFLGDSITQGWEGPGAEVWGQHYAARSTLNLGISGDRTQHVLWRLAHGNLDGLAPQLCVLMIGTNNANSDTGADIADGVFAILRDLRRRQPAMRILLLEIFPRGATPTDPLRRINDEANRLLRLVDDDPLVDVVDLSSAFLDPDGTLPTTLFPDLLHPNAAGYVRWADAMEDALEAGLR